MVTKYYQNQKAQPSIQTFFLNLSPEFLEEVFFEQLDFFIIQCQSDQDLVRNLFINLPLCLLLREDFLFSIHKYQLHTKLNMEVQYEPGTLTPEVMSLLKNISDRGVSIWIDDVDGEDDSIFNAFSGLGIKIDKHKFWSMYKEKKQLSVFHFYRRDKLIVEGVENVGHINYLKNNFIFFCQGYYWPACEYIN